MHIAHVTRKSQKLCAQYPGAAFYLNRLSLLTLTSAATMNCDVGEIGCFRKTSACGTNICGVVSDSLLCQVLLTILTNSEG